MKLLISILKAAHARSTHHYFALDALPFVETPRGEKLRGILLKYHQQYLTGAKDPDTKFKDFRNHVVHVKDNFWGGAPKLAQQWYDRLVEDLDACDWAQAAYSAGVLSHYFTDPIMPLHTAQSEIEGVVHRPLEWSVNQSYSRIYQDWSEGEHKVVFELAKQKGWLQAAIRQSASVANRYYRTLISHYNLKAGVKKPKEGFDERSIEILAGLFGVAITGWSKVLDRAAAQSTSKIPDVSLTTAALISTIKIPAGWVLRRLDSREEREAAKALFKEFRQTGTVKANLPPEVRNVRTERKRDQATVDQVKSVSQPIVEQRIDRVAANTPDHTPVRQSTEPNARPVREKARSRRKPRLALGDPIVDAPSIGRKTAKRFHDIGIKTVGEFLNASPGEMAYSLRTSWINARKLTEWQAQARLVCDVASLCGYKAQLLVTVECETSSELAGEDPSILHKRILQLAGTSAGKRILRSSKVPKQADVAEWVQDAMDIIVEKSVSA